MEAAETCYITKFIVLIYDEYVCINLENILNKQFIYI